MEEGPLPTIMACLNTAATVCLVTGYVLIRRKNVAGHRRAMLTAFVISGLFLTTYLLHHALAGNVLFRGQGLARTIYLLILVPHVLLAVTVLPLAIVTIRRGLSGRIALHRPLAKVTLPIWLYVSVTGVIVYVMLYRLGY
jgi:putative membrane protein